MYDGTCDTLRFKNLHIQIFDLNVTDSHVSNLWKEIFNVTVTDIVNRIPIIKCGITKVMCDVCPNDMNHGQGQHKVKVSKWRPSK